MHLCADLYPPVHPHPWITAVLHKASPAQVDHHDDEDDDDGDDDGGDEDDDDGGDADDDEDDVVDFDDDDDVDGDDILHKAGPTQVDHYQHHQKQHPR